MGPAESLTRLLCAMFYREDDLAETSSNVTELNQCRGAPGPKAQVSYFYDIFIYQGPEGMGKKESSYSDDLYI